MFKNKSTQRDGFAIDTLPSIRWSDDRIAVFGNLPAQP